MTAKKENQKKTKAGATELSEEEMKEAQGGWSWGETNSSLSTKVTTSNPLLQTDLQTSLQTDQLKQKVK
jgi:hypothetical protein